MAILTQAERNAAYLRVRRELGVDRIGTESEAKPLPARLQGGSAKRGRALPIEAEIHGAQMYEFEVWARPALDLRTRSFITVAALTATRAPNQLYRHINIALNLGTTPDEIHELLLHVSCYAGNPAWEEGVGVANEVFVARGVLPPGSGVTVEPKPPMNHEERRLARERIVAALGVGRIGLGTNAPVLKPLPGGPILASRPGTLDEEISFLGADYGYGELWGRPGLPLRIRSFITQAYDPTADLYDYAQTKAATMNFVKSLAKQFAKRGIRVNGVAPGPIWTPLQGRLPA